MRIKTVTTKSGVNQVEFRDTDDRYYWIKNKGDNSILVSIEHPDTLAEGEGITEVEPGEITLVENYGNIIYINGESEVEIREQDIPMCPFKASQKGGDMAVESDVSAEGDVIQLDGLQGGVPFSEVVADVNLSEMNLITWPFVDKGGDNVNGMKLTPSPDGWIWLNGTAESEITFVMNNDIPLKPLTTYTLLEPHFYQNQNSDYIIGVEVCLNIYDSNDSRITQYVTSTFDEPTGVTFKTDANAVRGEVVIHFEQGCIMQYVNMTPILVVGDVAYNEYSDKSTIRGLALTVWNKNRLTYPYANGSMFIPRNPDDVNASVSPHNGLIITDNGDGSITFNGNIPDTIYEELKDDEDALIAFNNAFGTVHGTLYELIRDIPLKVILPEAAWDSESEIKTCMLSGCPFDDELDYSDMQTANYYLYIRFHHDDANQGRVYFDIGKGVTIDLDDSEIEHASTVSIGVLLKLGGVDNIVFRPQLELGDTVTEYEPPSAKYYTIIPDSSPYMVDTDVYQLDGANEIRVTGLGNPKVTVKGVKSNAAIKKIWDKFKTLEATILTSEET